MENKRYTRRKFLGTASCAAVGSTTFFSTLFNLQSLNAASSLNSLATAGGEDYRALVCILLDGGNDSYNMIVPTDNDPYNEYQSARTNLAIPKADLLEVTAANSGRRFGFHPSMPEVQALFNSGKLGVISNIGTLVRPVTSIADYNSGVNLPQGLFSHNDQVHHWMTSVPQSRFATGWGGRLADLVQSANANANVSMNISLAGKNVFQLGNQVAEYSILPTTTGSVGIAGYRGQSAFDQIRTAAVNSLLERQYQDIFRQSYSEVVQASQNTHELFSSTISGQDVSTAFSEEELSQNLRMVARTIRIRQQLGIRRQTFFVRYQGWDHHSELLNAQSEMLAVLSRGMNEFQTSIEELGIQDCVTTFTVSDFGRTLSSNGNGTDHAWGSNVMVMGSQVKGQSVYGDYPTLSLTSSKALQGGVLIPDISTDEYYAELALWFGVNASDLSTLFPNIGNFYATGSGTAPIGFMNI